MKCHSQEYIESFLYIDKNLLVVLELLVLEMQGGMCLPATAEELTHFIIGI